MGAAVHAFAGFGDLRGVEHARFGVDQIVDQVGEYLVTVGGGDVEIVVVAGFARQERHVAPVADQFQIEQRAQGLGFAVELADGRGRFGRGCAEQRTVLDARDALIGAVDAHVEVGPHRERFGIGRGERIVPQASAAVLGRGVGFGVLDVVVVRGEEAYPLTVKRVARQNGVDVHHGAVGVAFGAEYLRVGHGRRGLRGEEVRAGADGEQEPEGGDMSDGSFHGYGILALPEIRR